MRGVAAMLVVLAHSFDAVRFNPDRYTSSRLAEVGHVENVGAIGVDLFFVISGFVMAFSVHRLAGRRQAASFLALRWIRIAPPFLIACALFAAKDWAEGAGLPTWRSIWNSVAFVPIFDGDAYCRPALVIGWTLSFEFTFYLAIAGMIAAGGARRLGYLAAAMVALGLAGAAADPSPLILDWVTNPIIIEFSLGIGVYELWRRGAVERLPTLWVGLGVLGGVALLVQLVAGYGLVSEDVYILDSSASLERVALWGLPMAAIFAAFLPVGATGARTVLGRFGRVLGDASYSIYLVHLLALLMMNQVLSVLPGRAPGDVVLLVGLVAGMVGGWVYWRLVERPLTERLRQRFARRAHTAPHLRQ